MTKRGEERVLVLVDEANVVSSVRTQGRGLDWLKLRDFLIGERPGENYRDGDLCRASARHPGLARGAG